MEMNVKLLCVISFWLGVLIKKNKWLQRKPCFEVLESMILDQWWKVQQFSVIFYVLTKPRSYRIVFIRECTCSFHIDHNSHDINSWIWFLRNVVCIDLALYRTKSKVHTNTKKIFHLQRLEYLLTHKAPKQIYKNMYIRHGSKMC